MSGHCLRNRNTGARVNICYLWLQVKKNKGVYIAAEKKTGLSDVDKLLNDWDLDKPMGSVVQVRNPDDIPELISGQFRVLADFRDKGVGFRRKQGKQGEAVNGQK